ncbi:MAG: hypothetical protein R3C49_10855 [Planctomycetaceae bacterium]
MCRSPNKPDADPTPIQEWKYDIVSAAILKAVGGTLEGLDPNELVTQVDTQISGRGEGAIGETGAG